MRRKKSINQSISNQYITREPFNGGHSDTAHESKQVEKPNTTIP